ncbi:hypothetical protein PVAP13_9KG535300 [Panicum virgatum]|uniref:Protein kinase domain-containing protein n=1 Tax=Panicum virgatum TaxID=38727 RepID=A0A8T0NXU8_PANVG|nr:hypothetical protein PVAP13_9KG535300 [Panicum virgatum]
MQHCVTSRRGVEPKVVHRLIKSSNILLDKKWNPKVSDFGMAKVLGPGSSYVTTRVMGTFGYVAPRVRVDGDAQQEQRRLQLRSAAHGARLRAQPRRLQPARRRREPGGVVPGHGGQPARRGPGRPARRRAAAAAGAQPGAAGVPPPLHRRRRAQAPPDGADRAHARRRRVPLPHGADRSCKQPRARTADAMMLLFDVFILL